MKKIGEIVLGIAIILPIVGIFGLKVRYTSADLNDEVVVAANSLKATTLAISIQNTVDNSTKSYLFNISRFQKDSLDATTIRVRNVGEQKTKYYLSIEQINKDELCNQPYLKILADDKIIYSDKINNLKMSMPEIAKGEKNDLIFILSMNTENSKKIDISCNYELNVSTEEGLVFKKGFYDQRKIESQIQMINN